MTYTRPKPFSTVRRKKKKEFVKLRDDVWVNRKAISGIYRSSVSGKVNIYYTENESYQTIEKEDFERVMQELEIEE